jgi:hypothetical protein
LVERSEAVQKRAKLGLRREQFTGLFDPGQSLLVLSWPLHAEYTIDEDGKIKGKGYDGRSYEPLEDTDLFPSFVRLGKRGQPSKVSILRWVKEHGLLKGLLHEGVNQRPMAVDHFRSEVRCARELASLYMDIREKDSAAIWARFVGEGEYREPQFYDNAVGEYFVKFHHPEYFENLEDFERFRLSLEPRKQREHPDHLKSGATAFENILEELIYEVTLNPLSDEFAVDDEGTIHLHSWQPHEPYHPVLSWRCPDLRSAIYLQFALMVTSGKPWRRCKAQDCRTPFQPSRKDNFYCDPKGTCRSRARKYRK